MALFQRLLALILAMALLAACGSATGASSSSANQSSADTAASNLLAEITARLGGKGIDKTVFGAPPGPFQAVAGHDPWLYVYVDSIDGSSGVLPKLNGYLLVGAYRAEAPDVGAEQLAGFSILSPDTPGCSDSPAADTCPAPGTYLQPLPVVDDSKWTQSTGDLRKAIESGLTAEGLCLVSLSFETATDSPIPIIIAETTDPRAFVKEHGDATVSAIPNPQDLEGYFLEVTDSDGSPVVESAVASRLSRGTGWARPDLAAYIAG